jgi:hypothetical protein
MKGNTRRIMLLDLPRRLPVPLTLGPPALGVPTLAVIA